jgi:hypothetical protein
VDETEEGCGLLAEVRERLGVRGLVLLNGCAERLEVEAAHCTVLVVTVDVARPGVHCYVAQLGC